jgi:DNA-binding transcriptional MerR regulator
MLRHYDAIGLLRPAAVDPATGYRFYRAYQLGQLNRILVLKDLGITLEQLRAILDGQVNTDQVEGMLRLRQAQLRAKIAADTDRLASIEAKLAVIGGDCPMSSEDVLLKEFPAIRVAALAATAASYGPEDISPVIQPLYPELFRRLEAAGVQPVGLEMACYEPAPGKFCSL